MFFFNDTATTEICTLSLHDALPIYVASVLGRELVAVGGRVRRCVTGGEARHATWGGARSAGHRPGAHAPDRGDGARHQDRKSTRLNSSHANISYAVFCLKKKILSLF